MAVLAEQIDLNWEEINDPALTDEEAAAFLVAFDAAQGRAKAACRALGVPQGAVYAHKAADEAFRDEWNHIRRRYRPLSIAGDELFFAIDAMDSMVGSEGTLDHLINVAFDPTQPPLELGGFDGELDPAVLELARDRVAQAGFEWAVELVKATGYLDREVKERLARKLAARRECNRRKSEKRARQQAELEQAGGHPSDHIDRREQR